MAESAAPKTKNPNEVCIVASYSTRGKSGHFAPHGSFILEGRYRVNGLIGTRGDGKIIDWLDELTADCPKKSAHSMNDPCGAPCPDLRKVL
jgi:hypothetical protein